MSTVPNDHPLGKATEQEALLEFYTSRMDSLNHKLDRHRRGAKSIEKEIDELNSKYEYLKSIYPEEFI